MIANYKWEHNIINILVIRVQKYFSYVIIPRGVISLKTH